MIGVTYEWIGLKQVDAGLAQVKHSLSVLNPLWETLGDEVRQKETELFAQAPWTPLTESYAEQKLKEFGDKPLLRASDVMFKSLTEEGAEHNINRIENLFAEFGTDDPKARGHHFGSGNLPERHVLIEFSPARAESLMGSYLEQSLKEAGFN